MRTYLINCAGLYSDAVARITGDCPLTDPAVIDSVCQALDQRRTTCDYASNAVVRSFPRGLDVEAADVCRELGITMARAAAVNDDPIFIDMMADVVLATVEGLFRRNEDDRPTVLLITHHVEELPPATSQVLILTDGKVAAQGERCHTAEAVPHQNYGRVTVGQGYHRFKIGRESGNAVVV